MHSPRPFRDDNGALLVEALVAVGLFAAAAVAACSIVAWSVTALRVARDTSTASRLASQQLEALVSQPVDPAPSPPSTLASDVAGFFDRLDEQGRPAVRGPVFTRRWRIEAVPGMMRVVVTVHHRSAPGRASTVAVMRRARP